MSGQISAFHRDPAQNAREKARNAGESGSPSVPRARVRGRRREALAAQIRHHRPRLPPRRELKRLAWGVGALCWLANAFSGVFDGSALFAGINALAALVAAREAGWLGILVATWRCAAWWERVVWSGLAVGGIALGRWIAVTLGAL